MAQRLIIEAGRTEGQYWRDLWRYRELFYFLAWRDFLIRYKQTFVGVFWALIRPVLTMFILTMVGKFGKLPTGGVPGALFFFCALLPWQFFSTTLSESSISFVYNANLVSKIYFPRLVVPASSVIVSFVDFAISSVFLVLLMLYYRFPPPPAIVFLPFFVVLIFAASLGAGLWTSALTVKYRDFRFVVPFVVQFGLYASVILQTGKIQNEDYRLLYSLNPIVGIIDGFRWCILGGENTIYLPGLVASIVGVVFLVVTGLWYFRKMERILADII
ncbi:MAG TPA: ABC transporter permease [Verrucomicrobiae bacterium]